MRFQRNSQIYITIKRLSVKTIRSFGREVKKLRFLFSFARHSKTTHVTERLSTVLERSFHEVFKDISNFFLCYQLFEIRSKR